MKSVKKIAEYFEWLEIEEAKQVRGLIEGTIDPDTFESVQNWCKQCYNEPPKHEKIMAALNEVLGGFGIETTDNPKNSDDYIEYINVGDTYIPTILYYNGKFIFSTWGDFVERKNW